MSVDSQPVKPKIKVALGLPIHGSMATTAFFVSIINTMNVLKQQGVECFPIFILGESLITRGRNNIVAKFMNDPDATHLMFIDSDISFDPVEVIKLLNHNKELVGGIYPLKTYKWENLSNIEEYKARNKLEVNKDVPEHEFIRQNLLRYNLNFKYPNFEIKNNLVEVKHIATGFMMIKRSCIEKMILHYPERKFWDDMGCLNKQEDRYAYSLFDCAIEDGHYLSEDWFYCSNFSKIGGQVWADVTINLTHWGISPYPGRFLSSLNISGNTQVQIAAQPPSLPPAQPTALPPTQPPALQAQPDWITNIEKRLSNSKLE